MKPLLLDRRVEADAPPGYTVVDSEAAWLRAVCGLIESAEPAFMVRGEALCDWAAMWWRGRGWPCEERHSILVTLRALCPAWSDEEARATLDDLPSDWQELDQRPNSASLLSQLYPSTPERSVDWSAPPALSHVATYLLWLENVAIKPHHAPLLAVQAATWEAGAGVAQGLYVDTSEEAQTRLRVWLEAWPENSFVTEQLKQRFSSRERWGTFPHSLPPHWERHIRQSAASQLAREGISAWHTARRAAMHTTALRQWAAATLDWLEAHSAAATPAIAQSLTPHVSPQDATLLRRLAPPPDPGNPFADVRPQPSDILDWTTARYTPWRLWQVEYGGETDRERALKLADKFGKWFLRFYSDAQFGAYSSLLALKRAQELRAIDTSQVTLWIIADGLGLSDAQALWSHIERRTSLLSYQSNEVAFATIPTVTHFAKPSLRYGVAPAQAMEPSDEVQHNAIRREIVVQGHRDVKRAMVEAQASDLVIWKPLEPDKTYHETADISLTRASVDGALAALAETIAEAARVTPDDLILRVLISTDHGRLLGTSTRSHKVPEGFTSHGRAAYTETKVEASAFNDVGVALWSDDDKIALLDPERFGLREIVAIALDDSSFQDNAGRGGDENFPHGGVFPEEVVVPWMMLARGVEQVPVEARGHGHAKTSADGVLNLEVVNPSALRLTLVNIELHLGARDERILPVDELLPAFDTLALELELSPWPAGAAARSATGHLLLRQSDGREYSVPLALRLESDELQTRDDILDDLQL